MKSCGVKPIKPRRLKVYYGHHGNSYLRHPVIRLAGKYLTQSDFKIGDLIEITIEQNHILISKLPQTETKA
jgi:hypothetical protein